MGYLLEIEADDELLRHLNQGLASEVGTRDVQVAFGRSIGWYAFVRILKPRVVVETGVHHGVGACLITRALMRNADDGHHGRYFGTDIDPSAGVLFTTPYSEFGEILYGDEADEYTEVDCMLSDSTLILGDNSHVTDSLRSFAERQAGRSCSSRRSRPTTGTPEPESGSHRLAFRCSAS